MKFDPATTPEIAPIDLLRTRSLANVVQTEIERMIVTGELAPSERVNEYALAQRLGVSRGPIREACSALAAVGLMQVITHRGFFIRELSEAEALDVSEARAGVFAYAVMLLAQRSSDEDVEALGTLVDRMDAIAPLEDVKQYYPLNLQYHAELVRLSGNQRLVGIYSSLVRELHIQRYEALSSGAVLMVSNAEHRAILTAVAAHEPERAFEAAKAHILNGVSRTLRAMRARPDASRMADGTTDSG